MSVRVPAIEFLRLAAAGVLSLLCASAGAQPNPYETLAQWLQPPEGRVIGSVSSVETDANGHIWAAERCGENNCAGHDELAPILLFDSEGRLVGGFGQGMFVWPHGIHVDHDGNIWVTDGRAEGRRGFQVFKFSPTGEILLTLGEAGVAGNDAEHFSGPTDVVVAPNGDIFVSDGHEVESNNRIVRFSADGRFVSAWGSAGSGPREFLVPHAIAMDSRGRLFVADRDNNRIQIFDRDGRFLDEWTQFGRPSGIHIDADDMLYVSDNQSDDERNPGWRRGIRVGSARDGTVAAFIPDPDFDPSRSQETSAHGIAADAKGNIFGAEVWSRTIKKYVPR
jgi:sugar lactone lactonase YvrE